MVQMWARTTTDPESATRTAIERVKTNVVMGCLDCQVAPVHGTPASSVIPGARLCSLPYNGSMLDINH